MTRKLVLLSLISFLYFYFVPYSGGAEQPVVKKILITGNTTVEEDTIRHNLTTQVDSPYNPDQITRDIQKIYDIGLFSDVVVDVEPVEGGVQVTFKVTERPTIGTVEIRGNEEVKKEDLKDALVVSPHAIFDPLKLRDTVQKLRDVYRKKGYYNVEINPIVKPDPKDPEEKVNITFQIQEGKKLRVEKVSFEGNKAFSDKQLVDQLGTKPYGFFSFLTGSGKFDEEVLKADLDRIVAFYADHGYIDARVVDYKLDFRNNKEKLFIKIFVDEGEQFKVGKVEIKGNTVFSEQEIREKMKVKEGDIFSRSVIRKDITAISDLYAQKGYVTPISGDTKGKLQITPLTSVDRTQKVVNLTLDIKEGVPHTLGRITIVGNRTTRDYVIRRELRLREGEPFDSVKLKRSRQRVINLGFFDEAKFDVSEGEEEDTVNLNIYVKERSTGSFTVGGGFSSLDKLVASFGLSQSNLFGLAHQVNFSATVGGKSQRFNLNYTVPRFLNSLFVTGVDAFSLRREYDDFTSDERGGGLRIGRPLTEYISGTFRYKYERVDISDVAPTASSILLNSQGVTRTSSLAFNMVRNSINNILNPTKGGRLSGTFEIAGGILQGDSDFYKFITDNSWYFPVLSSDMALHLRGEFGFVGPYGNDKEVPIFERFFGGGANDVRGYRERSIGPKDQNGDVIGGNEKVLLTTELIVPIIKGLKGVLFFDAGSTFGSDLENVTDEDFDLRAGTGLGIRFFSPLGPISLDWGYKVNRRSGESPSEVHFGVGRTF
ncbi:MAG TPA: outer membrane protein assembly factor BamA [Candidatus Limnocylindrales bacterium]|nr:outer membrane protein assembly factor BamA [Candidatus Limnocylindrales bacterium]